MPSTATYTPTGDLRIDGVLSGIKWGVTSLTFSFPTSGSLYGTSYANSEQTKGFEAFTSVQQDAVRTILKMYAAVSNLTFSEVAESSSVHGDLRYAESDAPSTAWAYYPSTNVAGGDAWFNNSKNWYDAPAKGNYAWLTMLHETGHALGLKHPHEASGSFGAMPTDRDSLEYTVMSYRSYVGASTTTGYTNGSGSYPQTLMMYDIAALQKLYGANFNTNSGDTVYSWSATTGEMKINGIGQGAPVGNKIFMTLWDGGGNDTYDLSGYAGGVAVDLSPGGWSITSTTQLASLGNSKVAVGNIANALLYNGNTASLIENAIGGAGADRLTGNAADNKLTGGGGNDILDGGTGTDTAVYSGLASNYSWLRSDDGSWTVSDLRGGSPDGADKLLNIEWLKFADKSIQLGTTTPPVVDQPPVVDTNVAPVAAADSYSTGKNKKLIVSATAGVLKNDFDADGDALSAALVKGPAKGKLTLKADGSFEYTPAKNFTGTVTFTYKAKDPDGLTSNATVTISVGTSSAANRKGAGETIWDDQIPAPGHARPGQDRGWYDDKVLQVFHAIKLAETSFSGGDKPLGLHKLIGLVDIPSPGTHSADPSHADSGTDSVPDGMKAFYSEFVLF
jgi:hypothetical protein